MEGSNTKARKYTSEASVQHLFRFIQKYFFEIFCNSQMKEQSSFFLHNPQKFDAEDNIQDYFTDKLQIFNSYGLKAVQKFCQDTPDDCYDRISKSLKNKSDMSSKPQLCIKQAFARLTSYKYSSYQKQKKNISSLLHQKLSQKELSEKKQTVQADSLTEIGKIADLNKKAQKGQHLNSAQIQFLDSRTLLVIKKDSKQISVRKIKDTIQNIYFAENVRLDTILSMMKNGQNVDKFYFEDIVKAFVSTQQYINRCSVSFTKQCNCKPTTLLKLIQYKQITSEIFLEFLIRNEEYNFIKFSKQMRKVKVMNAQLIQGRTLSKFFLKCQKVLNQLFNKGQTFFHNLKLTKNKNDIKFLYSSWQNQDQYNQFAASIKDIIIEDLSPEDIYKNIEGLLNFSNSSFSFLLRKSDKNIPKNRESRLKNFHSENIVIQFMNLMEKEEQIFESQIVIMTGLLQPDQLFSLTIGLKKLASCAFVNDNNLTNNYRILFLLREVYDRKNMKYPLEAIKKVESFVKSTKDHFLKSMGKEVLIRAWNQGVAVNKQILNSLLDRDRVAGLRIIEKLIRGKPQIIQPTLEPLLKNLILSKNSQLKNMALKVFLALMEFKNEEKFMYNSNENNIQQLLLIKTSKGIFNQDIIAKVFKQLVKGKKQMEGLLQVIALDLKQQISQENLNFLVSQLSFKKLDTSKTILFFFKHYLKKRKSLNNGTKMIKKTIFQKIVNFCQSFLTPECKQEQTLNYVLLEFSQLINICPQQFQTLINSVITNILLKSKNQMIKLSFCSALVSVATRQITTSKQNINSLWNLFMKKEESDNIKYTLYEALEVWLKNQKQQFSEQFALQIFEKMLQEANEQTKQLYEYFFILLIEKSHSSAQIFQKKMLKNLQMKETQTFYKYFELFANNFKLNQQETIKYFSQYVINLPLQDISMTAIKILTSSLKKGTIIPTQYLDQFSELLGLQEGLTKNILLFFDQYSKINLYLSDKSLSNFLSACDRLNEYELQIAISTLAKSKNQNFGEEQNTLINLMEKAIKKDCEGNSELISNIFLLLKKIWRDFQQNSKKIHQIQQIIIEKIRSQNVKLLDQLFQWRLVEKNFKPSINLVEKALESLQSDHNILRRNKAIKILEKQKKKHTQDKRIVKVLQIQAICRETLNKKLDYLQGIQNIQKKLLCGEYLKHIGVYEVIKNAPLDKEIVIKISEILNQKTILIGVPDYIIQKVIQILLYLLQKDKKQVIIIQKYFQILWELVKNNSSRTQNSLEKLLRLALDLGIKTKYIQLLKELGIRRGYRKLKFLSMGPGQIFEQKITEKTQQELLKSIQNAKLQEQIKRSLITIQKIQTENEIALWSCEKITQYAQKIKGKIQVFNLYKAIAVIDRAYSIAQNKKRHQTRRLKINQLISILLSEHNDQRKFLQIGTGQGKSIISVSIAIIKVLKGLKVHIFTSHKDHAVRDATENKFLYQMFGINSIYKTQDLLYYGVKKCYDPSVDILYATIPSMQFDIILEKYFQQKVRGDTNFDNTFAMIDEADHILMDCKQKYAIISNDLPGIQCLNPIFVYIWTALLRICKEYQQQNTLKQQEICTRLRQFGNQLCKIIAQEKKDNPLYLSVLPQFKKLVKIQMPKWVESAIQARFFYKQKGQYVIKEDDGHTKVITPVDDGNNGEVQDSSVWGNGLHQFLQLKQNIQLSPQSFITNFLSNKAYFQLYGDRVLAMSGTVGSKTQQKFLKESLRFQTHKIERLHYDSFTLQEPILTSNEKDWQQSMIKRIMAITNQRRPVVVICPIIQKAQRIYELLKLSNRIYGSTFLYTRSDSNQSLSVRYIFKAGDVLVSTNLTGRGTDIKLSNQSLQNGGLHVIVGFMPKNQRVYFQNLRRAARQGEKGSGQLIIDISRLPPICQNKSFQQIKNICWGNQDHLLKEFIQKNQKIMDLKTILFDQFCKKREQICIQLKNQHQSRKFEWNSCFLYLDLFWAIYLKQKIFSHESKQETVEKFKDTLSQINAKELLNNLIKSPTLSIMSGNQYLKASFLKTMQSNMDLLKLYQQGIKRGEQQGYQNWIAYYKAGYVLARENSNNQSKALEYLKKSLKILINKQIPQIVVLQSILMQFSSNFVNSQLRLQLQNTLKILQSSKQSISDNITNLQEGLKLVDLCYSNQNMSSNLSRKSIQHQEAKHIINFSEIQNKNHPKFISIRLHSLSGRQGIFDDSKAYSVKNEAENLMIGGVWDVILPIKSKFMAIQDLPYFYLIKYKQVKSSEAKGEDQIYFEKAKKVVDFAKNIDKDSTVIKNIQRSLETGEWIVDKAKWLQQKKDKTVGFFRKHKQNYLNWWNSISQSSKIPVSVTIYGIDQSKVRKIVQRIRSSLTQNSSILQFSAIFTKTKKQQAPKDNNTKIQSQNNNFIKTVQVQKIQVKYTLTFQKITQQCKKLPTSIYLDKQSSLVFNNKQIKPDYVQFKGISQELAYLILKSEKNQKNMEQRQQQVSLKYEDIKLEQLKYLGKLHKQILNKMVLEVKNLKKQQVLKLFQTQTLKSRNKMQVTKTVPIRKLFSFTKPPFRVIQEKQKNGLDQLYYMTIQKNFPYDTYLIAAGAVAQFGLSFAFSGGAIPAILISNACFDLIYAGKCAYNRQVDLEDFVVKKSINLALSVASAITCFCCGTQLCSEAANGQHFMSGLKHLVHLLQAEFIFKGSQWGFMKIVDQLRGSLRPNIQKNVRKIFSCDIIRKNLQVDTINKNKNKFKQILKIIQNQKTSIQSIFFNKFMAQTSQAFVSATSTCNHTFFSKIQLLIGSGNTLYQYLKATDEISTNILNKIEKISSTSSQNNQAIQKYEYEIQNIVAAVSQIIENYIIQTIRTNIINPASALISYKLSEWSMGKLRKVMSDKFNIKMGGGSGSGSASGSGSGLPPVVGLNLSNLPIPKCPCACTCFCFKMLFYISMALIFVMSILGNLVIEIPKKLFQ